jgi:hypothetical protein
MIYQIYNLENNIVYYLEIEKILNLIKDNIKCIFYKIIDNKHIKINNNIILNTIFIIHRVNTINELNTIDKQFGVEIDIRNNNNNIILSHDPFNEQQHNIDLFKNYLKKYNNTVCSLDHSIESYNGPQGWEAREGSRAPLILNIKSERLELKCIELLEKYNITNYFFLDSSIPMIYLLYHKYNNNNIACRLSEYEPIEFYYNIKNMTKYIWVDCFSKFILTKEYYDIFINDNKKICIVSPELQNQKEKIIEYKSIIDDSNIIPHFICCKKENIINWI